MISIIQYQTGLWTQVDKLSQSYQYNVQYNIYISKYKDASIYSSKS